MAIVPCNGCTACCHGPVVLGHGDDPEQYETEILAGEIMVLRRNPDGSCIYLAGNGCSIWGRAPERCQAFDCRVWAKTKWATLAPPFGDEAISRAAARLQSDQRNLASA